MATVKHATVKRKAKHGERMIEIKLRFWTNGLAGKDGEIMQKRGWTSGVVRIEPNQSHGIKPGKPRPFHSLLDVGSIIEKVLIEHGIVLHAGQKMQKYLKA